MFSFSYDAERLILIAIGGSGAYSDADYEQLSAQIDELDRQGAAKNKAIAFVIDVDPNSSTPDAKWRRRFADQRKAFKSPRIFTSVVARSALVRGVMTAMNWISPEPPNVRGVAHGSFDEAASWIELTHGTSQAILRRMHGDAQSRLPKAAKTG